MIIVCKYSFISHPIDDVKLTRRMPSRCETMYPIDRWNQNQHRNEFGNSQESYILFKKVKEENVSSKRIDKSRCGEFETNKK